MENFRLPAEWEAQWGVMLTWPHEDTDWKPYLTEITETFVAMSREIAAREHLLIVVPKAKIVPEEVRQMERVVIFECPTDDTWARDHGPIVLVEECGVWSEECGVRRLWLDFRFNGWGEKFPAENDNRIVSWLFEEMTRSEERGARNEKCSMFNVQCPMFNVQCPMFNVQCSMSNVQCSMFNVQCSMFNVQCSMSNVQCSMSNVQCSMSNVQLENHQDFVLEGGSIESDGRGTIFTTSQCLLAPNRNQPFTREEIEAELKRRLRAERVVWLDHGNLVGDDTDGHIDTIVRCAPDDTLLYVGCDDENDEQFADFQALEQQLKSLQTADGKPYRLLRLPMPKAIFEETISEETISEEGGTRMEERERLPATYANFLILNGAVLAPIYGQPENDAEALRVIGEAFPDRDIIPIDARTIIRQHGSIHCLTMQIPSQI